MHWKIFITKKDYMTAKKTTKVRETLIDLGKDWALSSDEHQWILGTFKTNKTTQEKQFVGKYFLGDLVQVFKVLNDIKLRTTPAASIKDIIDNQRKINKEMRSIFKKNGLKI